MTITKNDRDTKNTKEARGLNPDRWTAQVVGDLLAKVDKARRIKSPYMTRSTFQFEALSRYADEIIGEDFKEPGQASQPEPVAKVTTPVKGTSPTAKPAKSVKLEVVNNIDANDLGIDTGPGIVAGNPFPEVEG